MALPVGRNISIYMGDSYRFVFKLYTKNTNGSKGPLVNLAGSTVRSQIRATEDSSSVLAVFAADHNNAGGTVTLDLTPAQTTGLPATGGMWDVQIAFPDETVTTFLKGTVTVVKEVTRDE